MRPPGEIRSAICDALRDQGPMPLVDLMERINIQTTHTAISRTVENAVRCGVIAKVGHEKRSHCNKAVAVYDVVTCGGSPVFDDGGIVVLGSVLGGWR